MNVIKRLIKHFEIYQLDGFVVLLPALPLYIVAILFAGTLHHPDYPFCPCLGFGSGLVPLQILINLRLIRAIIFLLKNARYHSHFVVNMYSGL
jgi:hypothetical protein